MMKNMNNILTTSHYLIVNKELIRKLGTDASVLLSHLLQLHLYCEEHNLINENNGFFWQTANDIRVNTGLTNHRCKSALEVLKRGKICKTKVKGIPAKTHYKIYAKQVEKILKTSLQDFMKQDFKKSKTINKNNNKNNLNKISNIETRFEIFKTDVKKYVEYKDHFDEFIEYWSEKNPSGTKMRFEMQKTWNTSLRLGRWARNNFNGSGGGKNKYPEYYDREFCRRLPNEDEKTKYYKHLKSIGWESVYTPTAGQVWRKKRTQ